MAQLLSANGIRPTKIRGEMLRIFFAVNYALSPADIVKKLNSKADRVTIYRTLSTFEKKKLIHRVVDDVGMVRFASHEIGGCDLNFLHHRSNHLHFRCLSCGNIYCLCSIELPTVDIPKGFFLKNLKLMAEGFCANCAGKNFSGKERQIL